MVFVFADSYLVQLLCRSGTVPPVMAPDVGPRLGWRLLCLN